MYQKHFGLKTKPFGSNAEGPAVFVGPQQTQVINSLKKGLNAVDSVVAVSGPVGVGKTTIVSRTLESLSPGRMVAMVGRMKLAPDEVLELLLTGFGVSRQATGTIQRFAAFRRLLTERAAAGAQVAIVVEDAQRVGLDALVELESLTAADSGDATGANIILMGQLDLNEWLATPALARLRQRTRLRQVIEPFTAPEVLGYLRHCIRAAGGDFDRMFDGGAVDMLYRCSEGIPRVINNLCESALTMAAEEDAGPLTAKFIQTVARDALGIEVFLPHTPAPPIAPVVAPEAVSPQPKPESMPAPDLAPEKTPEPAVSAEPDIESTLTQKKPEWTIDQVGGVDASNEELPQELTFEVEQTARMQAINADKIIQAEKEGKKGGDTPEPAFKAAPMITVNKNTQVGVLPKLTPQAETKPSPAQGPADDDLPMLSQSMRIEAPTPAPPEALLAEARPKPKPLPGAKPTPEPTQKPQAAEKPASKPQAEAKPVPKPKVSEAEKAEPKPKLKAPAAEKAEPKLKAPAAEKAEPKLKAPAAEKAEPKLKAPAAEKAEPKPQAKPNPAEKPKAKAKPDWKASEKPRMPDIDTLEAAIEAAHQDAADDEPAAAPAAQKSTPATKPAAEKPVPATKPAAEKPVPAPQATAKKPAPAPEPAGDKGPHGTAVTLTGVPALTLDDVLEEKRSKSAKVIETEEELGKAESLNDLTNTMAETLFGDESFAAIAAEVVANPPPGKTAPGKSGEDASPVMLDTEEQAPPVMLETANESASADASKPESPAKGPKNTGQTGNFEMTMSKRMDMLKALNSGTKSDKKAKPEKTANSNKSAALEKIELIEDKPAEVAPKANGSQLDSIEQQMETAMTATVKAISDVDIPPGVDDEESDDGKSGGLFSRFKRS